MRAVLMCQFGAGVYKTKGK